MSWTKSQASAFWLELSKPTDNSNTVKVQVIYGYIDDLSIRHRTNGKEYEAIKDFEFKIRSNTGLELTMPLTKKEDCWEGTFSADANTYYQIIGINQHLPVIVRNEKDSIKNIRSIEYLYAEYGRSFLKQELPPLTDRPYIALIQSRSYFQVLPYIYGEPVTNGSTVRIFNPENWEKNILLDPTGKTIFQPTQKGLYIVRLDWYEDKSGSDRGIPFNRIRHRCNYCLTIYK